MCCLLTLVGVIGPRGLLFLTWLADPRLFTAAYDWFLVPVLGFFFLPWTTLVYVLVAPSGISVPEGLLLVGAIVADLVTLIVTAYSAPERSRQQAA